ncbi:DUF726 domain-containing protein [Blumeria hordei DH14]|uniref:DUF726 domain-containing protein n=1 Tax=Blumeria graminis f. sp. hordei (strain DH14) TaxID=546991 RepID=N1J6X7_BLUG1|nr:DUF726 domain-containing protein [Blumeria hordei DH14]
MLQRTGVGFLRVQTWMGFISKKQATRSFRTHNNATTLPVDQPRSDAISKLSNPATPNLSRPQPNADSTHLDSIDNFLAQPSWSVHTMLADSDSTTPEVSDAELQNLIRLSALPQPDSSQAQCIRTTLLTQLRFVQAIQRVDTSGVAPFVCLRNETDAGRRASTIGLADLKAALSHESYSGKCARPRRRQSQEPPKMADWDVLGASLNVTEMNGEKYFTVKSGADTETIPGVMQQEYERMLSLE